MIKKKLLFVIMTILFIIIGNSYLLWIKNPFLLIPLLLVLFWLNVIPSLCGDKAIKGRLRICLHGTVLLQMFIIYLAASVLFNTYLGIKTIPNDWQICLFNAINCTVVGSVVFWNGIISVYVGSRQIGMKMRVLGIIFGLFPILNLILLSRIVLITKNEIKLESNKIRINKLREKERICATKYPIVFVHGIFFRDSNIINYWGRIPKELERNGAQVFYGGQQSALAIKDSATELAIQIREIVGKTKCKKVNIIAHSKGGLDTRYAIQNCGLEESVASLTTVNTPHRGCKFADYILEKAPERLTRYIANKYNKMYRLLGDESPNFLSAVKDLTSKSCTEFNKNVTYTGSVYCQSVGSVQKRARSGKFPLNLTYHLVNVFDGENDGLVGSESFPWGERYISKKPKGRIGISHADMVDLSRTDIPGFDVREFYVELVSDLKTRGF